MSIRWSESDLDEVVMIVQTCPGCERKLRVPDGSAAGRVECPGCGAVVLIVAPALTPPPPADVTVPASQVAEGADPRAMLSPPQATDEIGRLGGYRVLGVLGAGGMGVVFRAEDPQLARQVALKVMLPGQAGEVGRKRFLREARAAAAIEHDHIVPIFAVGEEKVEGVVFPFLAMPLLQGEPLDACLAREKNLPAAEVIRIARQIALGLAAAHERGLIHRDVKPGNVWLEAKTGRVKILDFGLVRSANAPAATEEVSVSATSPSSATLTQMGAIVGTPAYVAPEQIAGEKVDERCDLFALGCVTYLMATGEQPFQRDNTLATLNAVAVHDPAPPHRRNPAVPRELSKLIMQLLATAPLPRRSSPSDSKTSSVA